MSSEDENIVDEIETTSELSSESNIDIEKVKYYSLKTLDITTIAISFIGILAILSYPFIHIINAIFKTTDFMKILPIGYTSSVAIKDLTWLEPITMFVFGLICLLVALKLGSVLVERYSIVSRVSCVLFGSGFMYLMISEEANAMLIHCLEGVAMFFFMIVIGIPVLHFCLWFATPLHNVLPPPDRFLKGYYGPIFKIFMKN